jgi:VPDSG-CTERM motif
MKPLKYLAIIGAALFALTFTAQAHLEFQGAVDFNNGPNGPPESNLNVLTQLGIDTTGFVLCGNIENLGDNAGDQNIDVMAGSYLVVHYGKGPGGTGSGGSWEVFLVAGGETNVTVPGKGNVGGFDPFGHGGISSIREFCPPTTVPDSGTTAMLLGGALTGLGLVRRYLKR